jgi:hypothetical protein
LKTSLLLVAKLFLLVLFFATALQLQAQDSLATVIFYREAKIVGAAITYKLRHGETVVGEVKPGSVLTYHCAPGLQKFWAHTESKNFTIIDAKAGETYYVECSVGIGVLVGTPVFRQVRAAVAQPPLRKMTNQPDLVLKGADKPTAVFTSVDTVGAVNHLFQRKRRSGTARGIILGGLGVYSLVSVASADDADTESGGGYAIGAALLGIGITGFVQANKYTEDKARIVLEDYQNKKKIPAVVVKKLKKKDFK